MKLLTLNTHSLMEENMNEKLNQFVFWILENRPDVIALQEVNQSIEGPEAKGDMAGWTGSLSGVALKADNYALTLARKLKEAGLEYFWSWLPIKVGYSRFDEGLAVFSRKPVLEAEEVLLSTVNAYENYRTRKALGIRTEDGWFYSAHFSWWGDVDEPFLPQWKRMEKHLASRKGKIPVFVMGDFNSDAFLHGESADEVRASGYIDLYDLADRKDHGMTVGGLIDGWEDQPDQGPKRIDQIWTDQIRPVRESRVVFNGQAEPVISDHYGVFCEVDL